MRLGRPVIRIVLSPSERETLERYTRRATTAQALALRARIILRCAAGETHTDIAADLRVTTQTVGKWRRRFVEPRLDGLLDEPRPGAPRNDHRCRVERVVTTTLESTPRDATHWSTRTLAEQVGLSQTTVSRIWRAFGLQPHRTETFKLSTDPLFVEKVRDVVGLYLHPPDRAIVLCVDEKSQIQALDRTQPLLPMRPGPARTAHARLRPARDHVAVRRAGRGDGTRDRRVPSAASASGVPQVPGHASTPHVPADLDVHSGPGQLRDAQDAARAAVVRCGTRAFTCTSRRPARRGSTWSSGGSPSSPRSRSSEAPIAARAPWRRPSTTTSPSPTRRPRPFVWTKTADEILAPAGGAPPQETPSF